MHTINKHSVFEDNQVLTASQLNSIPDYLGEQIRISRTLLLGTGIVCGLQVTMDKPQWAIRISKGTGVTSEGFLITLGDCVTKYYRDYSLPVGVGYDHFIKTPDDESPEYYKMFELLTTDKQKASDNTEETIPGVKTLDKLPESFEEYVVVLFLEIYDKQLNSCLGKSCDEIGIERLFTVRKLLVKKGDLAAINEKELPSDGPNKGSKVAPNLQPYRFIKHWNSTDTDQFDLERLHMPRPLLTYENTGDAGSILWQYTGISLLALKYIMQACSEAYDVFRLLLQKSIPANPFTKNDLADWENTYAQMVKKYLVGAPGFQYFYDFLHDLTLAYNEFCCAAAHLANQCIPVEKSFPLHLMLGEVSCPLSPFRQHFVSSPILNEQKEQNEKVLTLYNRIVAMLYSFDADIETLTKESYIIITPSKEKNTRLGLRAIPVYYNLKAETPYNFTLADVWNEELCLPCRRLPAQVTSYHTQQALDKQTSPTHPHQTPLFYNINDYPFLRIEGHIGQQEKTAREKLFAYSQRFNLDFKTITLFVGQNGEVQQLKCVFSDLETDYAIWRNKLRFVLTNLLKGIKALENIGGIGKAVKNEGEYFTKKKKEEPTKETANPQESAAAGGEVLTTYNTGERIEMKKTGSAKWADYARRAVEFKIEKGEEQPTADEEELSQRIAQIRNCIKELIAATPGDLEDFDFVRWCDAYRCALNKWIAIMKQLVARINDENSSEETRNTYRTIVVAMHFADEFLNFILTYPYLTIATINDTVQRRMQALQQQFTLNNTLKHNPGLEHTAGVYRGQTFVLVAFGEPEGKEKNTLDINTIIAGEPDSLFMEAAYLYKELTDNGHYKQLAAENKGVIFADLTGTVCQCDPCEDIDVDNYNVTPIAFPLTRIIIEKDGEYSQLRIQLLNNVYNPDEYEPFSSDGTFGTVDFEQEDYLPEDGKKSKILLYTPNAEAIKAEKKRVVTDTLNYAFINPHTGETVSESTITIFIGREEKEEVKEGMLTGLIDIYVDEKPRLPSPTELTFRLDGNSINIDGVKLKLYRNVYELRTGAGSHVFEVTAAGYGPQGKTVVINAETPTRQDYIFGKVN